MDLGVAELRHSGSSFGRSATSSPSSAAAQSKEAKTFTGKPEELEGEEHDFRVKGWSLSSLCPAKDDRLYKTELFRRISIAFFCTIVLAGIISLPPVWNRLVSIRIFIIFNSVITISFRQSLQSLNKSKSGFNGDGNMHDLCRILRICAGRKELFSVARMLKMHHHFGRIHILQQLPGSHVQKGMDIFHICNAVGVAKIMNATLILPILKQDQIWKDQTKFEDVFDVDHFIEYLKHDVPIVRDIPAWFLDKEELFTSIRRTVKNIPKYASAQFYLDNVLPRIKEKKIMALKPFVDRLGYDNVPAEINRLRCRVNYHALKFLPEIENMAEVLASMMRNRTGLQHPYMALHLRFEKGMVGLSFCDFVGARSEKAMMAAYRQKEWPRRYKNGSHLWQLALQKRKEGRCPLEPAEVAVILKAMGYPKETQIYVASGQVYGGENRMAPLRNMFPNLVTKEELTTKEELEPFRKHITSLAALDFLVCLKSDVFVMTHGGNFAKLIIGARRYMGHRQKSIKPNKGVMSRALGDPFLSWPAFVDDVVVTHETRTGLPESTFPNYDIWENPLSHCMCKA